MNARPLLLILVAALLSTTALTPVLGQNLVPMGTITGADDGTPFDDALIQGDDCNGEGSFSIVDPSVCQKEPSLDPAAECGARIGYGSQEVACPQSPAITDFHPEFTFDPALAVFPGVEQVGLQFFTYDSDAVTITVTLTDMAGLPRDWTDAESSELVFSGLSSVDGSPYTSWCPVADCASFRVAADSVAGNVATFTVSRALLENGAASAPVPLNGWSILAQDLEAEDLLLTDNVAGLPEHKFGFYNPAAQAAPVPQVADVLDAAPFPVFVIPGGNELRVSPTSRNLNEAPSLGSSGTVSVSLASRPLAPVTVSATVRTGSTSDISVAGGELTFTPANFGTAQTITVSALDDSIDGASTETHYVDLAASSLDSRYEGLDGEVSVSVTDQDVPQINVNCSDAEAAEAMSSNKAVCTVSLGSTPTHSVFVDVLDSTLEGRATYSPNVMQFTSSNGFAPKTLTISAVNDHLFQADQVIDMKVFSSSQDPGYNLPNAAVRQITILDDEMPAIVVDAGDGLDVTEGGATDSYTLRFAETPRATQQATVAITTSADLTAPATAVVTSVAGTTVSVTASNDAVDETDPEAATISHSTADNIAGATNAIASLDAAVHDNDVSGIAPTVVDGSATEGDEDEAGDIAVVLTSEPTGTVVLTVSGTAQATVDPATLTFTDEDWNVAQHVTVAAVDDLDIEAVTNAVIGLAVDAAATADANYDTVTVAGPAVAITSDDAAGIVITPATTLIDDPETEEVDETTVLDVAEGGVGSPYTIAATTTIPAGVSVAVTVSTAGAELGAAPVTVTLDSTNALTGATVTLSSPEDTEVEGAEIHLANHAIDVDATTYGPYDAVTGIAPLHARIVDNDVAATILDLGDGVTVSEVDDAGTGADERLDTFTVKLSGSPGAAGAAVTFTVPDGLTLDADSVAAGDQSSVTFTPANFGTPRTVTVSAVDNDVDEGTSATLSITGESGGDPDVQDPSPVSVTVLDNDVAALEVSAAAVALTEASGANHVGTYQVALSTKPAFDVVITIADGASTGDVTIDTDLGTAGDQDEITFTAANYATPRSVQVTAVDDALIEGAHGVTLANAAESEDSLFDGLSADKAVAITDNDAAGFTLSVTSLTVLEGDNDGETFTLQLTAQPAAAVTVNLAIDAASEEQVVTQKCAPTCVPTSSIVIQPADWATPITVGVLGADDSLAGDDDDSDATLTVTTGSTDLDFNALPQQTVAISIIDDDVGVILTPTSLSVVEGGSKSYTVQLTDSLDDVEDYVGVTLQVDTDPETAGIQTGFQQQVESPADDLGCGLLLNVSGQIDQEDQLGCSVTLVFIPGQHNFGDGTGDRPVTVEVLVPDDNSFTPLEGSAQFVVMHTPSSADPHFRATADEPLPVTRVDNDPSCPADVTQPCEATTGDGLVAVFAPQPVIVVGEEDLAFTVDLYELQAGAWEPYTGPATLSLQRDCGAASEIAGAQLEGAGLCADERLEPFEFTVVDGGATTGDGTYAFAVSADDARARLFPLGAPVSAVHLWVEASGRTSSYAHPTAALAQGAPDSLDLADRADHSAWHPIPIVDAQPDMPVEGDGFIADIGLPGGTPAPLLSRTGEDQDFTVTVLTRDGEGVYAPATSGQYALVIQVDCGPLPVGAAVQCGNEPANAGKTVTVPFTAAGADTTVTVTDTQVGGLFQDELPVSAVHVWVEHGAGPGYQMSNYALPTDALLSLGENDLVALADIVDANLWHPVPLVDAALPPLPDQGDGFVATIGLPTPAGILLDGETEASHSFSVVAYQDAGAGFASDAGSYTLNVQVDCGEAHDVLSQARDCAGGDDTTTKTVTKGFTTNVDGEATVVLTHDELASLFEDPLTATAVHVWVEAADGRQSNYAALTALAMQAGTPAAQAVDQVDAQLWHPVALAMAPEVVVPTPEQLQETVLDNLSPCTDPAIIPGVLSVCRTDGGLLGLGVRIELANGFTRVTL